MACGPDGLCWLQVATGRRGVDRSTGPVCCSSSALLSLPCEPSFPSRSLSWLGLPTSGSRRALSVLLLLPVKAVVGLWPAAAGQQYYVGDKTVLLVVFLGCSARGVTIW